MIRFLLLLLLTCFQVSQGLMENNEGSLEPRDAAREALRSKSLSGLMKLWDGIHKNIDMMTGKMSPRSDIEPEPEEMCHLRCCGNNSLPHVFEADDGMSARVECYDPVEQKVLFQYHYHCYGDKNGPPRYAKYPCETVGCLGQGLGAARDGECHKCGTENGRPLRYDFGKCVSGDCVSKHTTLYGERSCKCVGLMSDGKCLDPGEVLSPESMLANEKHEGESVIELPLAQVRWLLNLAKNFDKYDKNMDGFIDKDELNTAQRQDKLSPQLSQRLQNDVLMKFGSTMNNDRFRGLSLQDINALTDTKQTVTYTLPGGRDAGSMDATGVQNLREIGLGLFEGELISNPGFDVKRMRGSYQYQSSIAGWKSSRRGVVSIRQGSGPWGELSSGDGSTYLGLQRSGAYVEQTITGLRPNKRYRLFVRVASRPRYHHNDQVLTVKIGSLVVYTSQPSKEKFEEIVMGFQTDVKGFVKIRLENTSPERNADTTVFVDRVQIVEAEYDDVGQGPCVGGSKSRVLAQCLAKHSDVAQSSREECENRCSDESKCSGFNYVSDSKICTLYVRESSVVHSEVEACIEQTSRFELVKGAGDGKGRCMKKHNDGYNEIAGMLRRGGFTAQDLVKALKLRGTFINLNQARIFLRNNDDDPHDGRLSKAEIIGGMDKLTPQIHIGGALAIPKDMYERLESLTPEDFSNLDTLNTFTPDMFASLMRKKGLTHYSEEDARVLFDSLVSSEDLTLTYEKLQNGFVKIKDQESFDDSLSDGISVMSASYGANCDLDFSNNMLEMSREACNGKMSCAFEPDWTQFPREYTCDREIEVSFTCPDASARHVKIGSGCSDTGGGSGNTCSDAQGSVFELSCEGQDDSHNDDGTHVEENDEVDIAGGGWRLVRRVRAGKQWHPATDHLKGTDRYGPVETTLSGWRDKKDVTWTTPFAETEYDQVMVALCDLSKWMILSRSQIETADGSKATIVQSSNRDSPYQVSWLYRKGKSGDPVISMTNANDASNVLYREDSEQTNVLEGGDGACVFVRNKDVSRGDLCPSGEYEHGGICSACKTECPLGSFMDGGCIGHYDTQCSTCDEMCSETTGCVARGTLKNVECRTCRYVEESEGGSRTRCKRQCTGRGINYNRNGVCTACTKTCGTNTFKTKDCTSSKDFHSDHDLQCRTCRRCVGRSFDSGQGCNRSPGRVSQDRVCTSCHSQCRSPPWWRYHHEPGCNGPRDDQCRFGCKVVHHGGRCLSQCPRGLYKNGGGCSKCSTCPTGYGWYKYRNCNIWQNTGCGWSWSRYWHEYWRAWRRRWRRRWRWWSDSRLKCDVSLVESREDGLSTYSFRYLGGLDPFDTTSSSCDDLNRIVNTSKCEGPTYIGVIAQNLLGTSHEHAVHHVCGDQYYAVDYNAINQTLSKI